MQMRDFRADVFPLKISFDIFSRIDKQSAFDEPEYHIKHDGLHFRWEFYA